MASSVRIDGSLPDPGDSSAKGLVFAGGWGVEYNWTSPDGATVGGQPKRLSAVGFPVPYDNNLEGALSGSLIVNQANSADLASWQGSGNVDLKDGLLWEIPIFGIFSSVLNGLAPGLGSSRASAATGTFVITNGVVRSDDLEIRSPAMRLEYRGTVDLQGHVDARVEAELLRDVWLLGPLVSTVLWPVTKLFEYQLSGSLSQPKTDPVYFIPKIVLMPFHPFRSLKELVPEDSGPVRTNSPPASTP